MKKVLCLFVLLFIMVGLCSCDDLPANEPAGSETTGSDNENNGGSNSNGTIDEKPVVLGIPANLKYEYSTGILSWDAVTDATAYVVSANGNEFASNEKSIYLPIITKTTKIKVKAKNASTESDWTNEITYTVDENDDFNNLKLFVLSELQPDTELLGIISYHSRLSPFTIICRVKIAGEEKIVRLSYPIPSNLHGTPLINIINSVDKESGSAYEIFDIVEYESFKKIMDDELCTQLKNFKNNGYEIECLASYTTRYNIYNGLAKFYVHSLIKAKSDNHIKYYGMSTTVNSEIGDGSAPYLENLKDARISTSYYSIGEAEAEKMYYELENEISSYGFNTAITDDDISRFDGDPKKISAPTNLKYDYRTGMLSWNSKGEVGRFIISANNNEYTSTEHSIYLPISAKTTVIKVKAENAQQTSEWSGEITYTVGDADEFNSLKLFVLGELKSDTKLLDIIHYNTTSSRDSYSFIIHCKVEIANEEKVVRLEYDLTEQPFSYYSVAEVLELIDHNQNPTYYIYGMVEYDSLKEIVDNDLANPFESLINTGYSVEYLKSYTTEYFYLNGQPRFFVYAIAKLEKETEVKYYGLRMIVKSDAGEGSQAYIENLSTATISSSYYVISGDIVEKVLLDSKNNAAAAGTNTIITDAEISRYDDVEKIIVTNLKYNAETGMLSWNSEGLIKSFIISVNGKEYTSTEHSMYLPISAEETVVKVKAQNDNYSSDWSNGITYNLDETDDFYNLKLFVLGELQKDTKLLEIVSYRVSTILTIICKVSINNEEKIVRLAYTLTSSVTYDNLVDVFDLIDRDGSSAYEIYDIVEYDSLKEIVDNNLTSLFEIEKSNGYTVEYLKSYTTNYFISNDQAKFFVHSIVKLENAYEVIYYNLTLTIKSTEGEGSQTYIENLSTAIISKSTFKMSNDVVEKALYESKNNVTSVGTNTIITTDDITRYDVEKIA